MGATPSQVVNNITSNISKTFNDTLYNTCNAVNLSQVLSGKCTDDSVSVLYGLGLKCITSFEPALVAREMTSQDIRDNCGGFFGVCGANAINITQTLTWNDSSSLTSAINNLSQNDIKNSLSQFSNTNTDQTIDQLSNNINKMKTNITDIVQKSITTNQEVSGLNYGFSNISLKSSAEVITKTLMTNTDISKQINSIANTVSQVSMGTYSTILTIGVIIIALFILTFLIIAMSKSKDLKDFLAKIIPYIIFVIVSVLITLIHVVLKPSYVTYKDTDGNVHLDKSKLVLFLSIYYIVTILLIVLVFYIRRKIRARSGSSEKGSSDDDIFSDKN